MTKILPKRRWESRRPFSGRENFDFIRFGVPGEAGTGERFFGRNGPKIQPKWPPSTRKRRRPRRNGFDEGGTKTSSDLLRGQFSAQADIVQRDVDRFVEVVIAFHDRGVWVVQLFQLLLFGLFG